MRNYCRIFVPVLLLAVISCASGNVSLTGKWGKITPDTEAKTYFEKYQVNPDMNYYICGSDIYPNAILGLNKSYVLDSTIWKKVELTEATLGERVTDMKTRAIGFGQGMFGFAVLDDKEKQIGIWYSLLSAATSVQVKEGNKVMIYSPDNDTYNRYEERNGFYHFR
jgi:hypothetical protein